MTLSMAASVTVAEVQPTLATTGRLPFWGSATDEENGHLTPTTRISTRNA